MCPSINEIFEEVSERYAVLRNPPVIPSTDVLSLLSDEFVFNLARRYTAEVLRDLNGVHTVRDRGYIREIAGVVTVAAEAYYARLLLAEEK